jgi:hypothetical protein
LTSTVDRRRNALTGRKETGMARKVADCRRAPSESNCTLTIIGEEDEVVEAAAQHAVSMHKHEDNAELREMIRGIIEDEQSWRANEPSGAPAA